MKGKGSDGKGKGKTAYGSFGPWTNKSFGGGFGGKGGCGNGFGGKGGFGGGLDGKGGKGKGKGPRECWICKSTQHLSWNCPHNQGAGKGLRTLQDFWPQSPPEEARWLATLQETQTVDEGDGDGQDGDAIPELVDEDDGDGQDGDAMSEILCQVCGQFDEEEQIPGPKDAEEEVWQTVENKSTKKKKKKKAKRQENPQVLITIEPEGINSVNKMEWEMVELAVDSCATETICGENMLTSIRVQETEASKRGVEYEVANGEKIPNMGGKQFVGISTEGIKRNLTAQVCEVNKPLLSVRKVVSAGNRVVFEPENSYIEDMTTNEKMWSEQDRGMYILQMWVRNPTL